MTTHPEPAKTMLTPVKPAGLAAHRLMFVVWTLALAFPATLWAANVGIGSGVRIEPALRSMKELRDQNLVRQRFDYSCGAAALATILRYGFSDEVTERDLLIELFNQQSNEELQLSRREGFSLLDLQHVAQARGYSAEGYRLTPQNLLELGGPVIVYIEPRGYRHFAVLRGIRGDRVYLADPSLGNVRMPVYRFLEAWLDDSGTGVIFVVEPQAGLPEETMPLTLSVNGLPQPEIMTAREMLAVGTPFVWSPELLR
jgi:hypothetical protein